MSTPLGQPPNDYDTRWMFLLWKKVTEIGGTAWSAISKTGSKLSDIEARDHADLQNINTAQYSHLTADQLRELTSGGSTALHNHSNSAGNAASTSNVSHISNYQIIEEHYEEPQAIIQQTKINSISNTSNFQIMEEHYEDHQVVIQQTKLKKNIYAFAAAQG